MKKPFTVLLLFAIYYHLQSQSSNEERAQIVVRIILRILVIVFVCWHIKLGHISSSSQSALHLQAVILQAYILAAV